MKNQSILFPNLLNTKHQKSLTSGFCQGDKVDLRRFLKMVRHETLNWCITLNFRKSLIKTFASKISNIKNNRATYNCTSLLLNYFHFIQINMSFMISVKLIHCLKKTFEMIYIKKRGCRSKSSGQLWWWSIIQQQ